MEEKDIRRRLIDNTKRLLQDNVSITIKDIAEASFVNIAAVNYYFGSKERLMRIVIEETIDDVKQYIEKQVISRDRGQATEKTLEALMTYIYNFSLENMGILHYLFLSHEFKDRSSSMLVDTFLSDNAFTKQVYQSLERTLGISDPKELFAKYMMLFSMFSIPLFIQISQMRATGPIAIDTFRDPEFRQYYIKNIMRVIRQ